MALKIITPPQSEPVSLAEAKEHLRIDGTDHDNLLTSLISAARRAAEEFCRRAFITQTWKLIFDADEVIDDIEVPRPPLQSVTSIAYYDQGGAQQAFASTNYWVDTDSGPGRIYLRKGATWPTAMRDKGSLEVQYKAGYGDAGANVPDDIRRAILRIIADMFEHPEDVITGTIINTVPKNAVWLLQPYRIYEL